MLSSCESKAFKTISKGTSNNRQIQFIVNNILDTCNKISANNILDETTATYAKGYRPNNDFEVGRKGCINSGTMVATANNTVLKYRLPKNPADFANGIIIFYARPNSTPATYTVKISDSQSFTNADVYTKTVSNVDALGFSQVMVNLGEEPTSQDGTGYDATQGTAFLSIELASEGDGVSTIFVFNSQDDLQLNQTVILDCIDNIADDINAEAEQLDCGNGGYDENGNKSIDTTISFSKFTGNIEALNPMSKKTANEDVFKQVNESATIEKVTVNGKDYGKVTIQNVKQSKWNQISAQLMTDKFGEAICDYVQQQLYALVVPELLDLDEDQFIIIRKADDVCELYFNAILEGQDVLVSYPQKAKGTEVIVNKDNLNTKRVQMVIPTSNGDVEQQYVYDNVLITTYPSQITNDKNSKMSISISVQPAEDGNLKKIFTYDI